MIVDYPFSFFGAIFVLTLAAGAWLGSRVQSWRIARLKTKLDLARLGIR